MPLSQLSTNFSSPIFSSSKRTGIVSRGLTRIAKRFKKLTVDTMVYSTPSGKDYARRGTTGFTRFHRASRRGQPPAVDTGNLIRSVEDQKISPQTHEVFVDDGRAPYGKFLERPRLDRPIMGSLMVRGFEDSQMQQEVNRMQAELNEG